MKRATYFLGMAHYYFMNMKRAEQYLTQAGFDGIQLLGMEYTSKQFYFFRSFSLDQN